MQSPLSLQITSDTMAGQAVHKFAALPFLAEHRQNDSLAQRIAAYAFRILVVLPALVVCSAGDILREICVFPVFAVEALEGRGGRYILEQFHHIAAQIIFLSITLVSIFLDRLPPANRLEQEIGLELRIEWALDENDEYMAHYLINKYLQAYGQGKRGVVAIRDLVKRLAVRGGAISLNSYPAYRALIPLIEQLTLEERQLLFVKAVAHNNMLLIAVIGSSETLEIGALLEAASEIAAFWREETGLMDRSRFTEAIKNSPILVNPIVQLIRVIREQRSGPRSLEVAQELEPDELYDSLFFLRNNQMVISNIKTAFPLERSFIKDQFIASTPLPQDLINLALDYLPQTHINPDGIAGSDWQASRDWRKDYYDWHYLSEFLDFSSLGERLRPFSSRDSICKHISSCGSLLQGVSSAIEKKVISLHVQGSRSAKFWGAAALGSYLVLDSFVFRPVGISIAFVASVGETIGKCVLGLLKLISCQESRKKAFIDVALTAPLLVAAAVRVALFIPYVMFMIVCIQLARPVIRAVNLFSRCSYTVLPVRS